MKVTGICTVYFSPTGVTARLAGQLAGRLAQKLALPCRTVDLTLPAARSRTWEFAADELVICGVPVYAGRVPNKFLPALQLLHGQKTPALALVSYGSRAFDSAPNELCAELQKAGFVPFAAGAFAVQHAFTARVGTGRPDADDLRLLEKLADAAADKLCAAQGVPAAVQPGGGAPVGPYYTPLGLDGQPAQFLRARPVTDAAKCDRCGICAAVCPMGAIDAKDVFSVPGTCIKCQACIQKCPRGAKYFADEAFLSHVAMLEKTCLARRAPQLWW